MTFEAMTGSVSVALTMAGWAIGQAEVGSVGGSIVGLITQFGGLGLAVWLVYQHTTVTIPQMQKEHREERQAALLEFKAEIDLKRKEYLESLQKLTTEYTTELHERRLEIIQAIKDNACRAKVQP
jgi:hypothetical protein